MTQYIMLNDKKQKQAMVLGKLIRDEIKLKHAAKLLKLSPRQIIRKTNALREKGLKSLIHGNTNRQNINGKKVSSETIKKIVNLYHDEYLGWNFSHFHEKLQNHQINISYSLTRQSLLQAGYSSPRCLKHKKRKSHPPRNRRENFGELIQVDASKFQWFENDPNYYHLHAAIDDATGMVVGAYFCKQETILGYQMVLSQIIKNHGIPACFYTDFRTVFQSNKKSLTLQEQFEGKTINSTKFKKVLDKFGINLLSTSSPQSKGKIERLWGTFQDRLFNEMKKLKINSLEQANEFLSKFFLKSYNQKFAQIIDKNKNLFCQPIFKFDPNFDLATFEQKTVLHHCYIKHQNQYYVIKNKRGNNIFISGKPRVDFYHLLNGEKVVKYNSIIYKTQAVKISEIEKNKHLKTKNEKTHNININQKLDNPWKRNYGIEYLTN